MKLWGFRDLATGTVRVTGTDPANILDGLGYVKQTGLLTGGVGFRAMLDNIKPLLSTLEGQMGAESYIEISIDGLTDLELTALMTPPAQALEPEPK